MEMPALDPNQRRILERLRAICLALPDAREEMKWGHPNWTVGGKIFAAFGFYGGGPSLATKQTPARQAQLIDDPERFFPSPYVGQHGWTSMRLEGEIEWSVVESLVKTSHGHVSAGPKAKSAAKAKSTEGGDAAVGKRSPKKKAVEPADSNATIVAAEPKKSERSGPTKKTKPAGDVEAPSAKPAGKAAPKSKVASAAESKPAAKARTRKSD
jgi:predicted DNA-binding protein (MmcQ/YjbR family)